MKSDLPCILVGTGMDNMDPIYFQANRPSDTDNMMEANASEYNFQGWVTISSTQNKNIDKAIYQACTLVFEKKYGMSEADLVAGEEEKKDEEVEEEKEKPFDLTQVIKLMSPNMHKIVSYKGGYKRVKPQGQTSNVVERTTRMFCSASREYFDSKETKGFCSSLQACDYILKPYYSRC